MINQKVYYTILINILTIVFFNCCSDTSKYEEPEEITVDYVTALLSQVSKGNLEGMYTYFNHIENSQFVDDIEYNNMSESEKRFRYLESQKDRIKKKIIDELKRDCGYHKGYEPYKSLLGYESIDRSGPGFEFNAILQSGISFDVIEVSEPEEKVVKRKVDGKSIMLKQMEQYSIAKINYEKCKYLPANRQRELAIELVVSLRFVKFLGYGRKTYSFQNINDVVKMRICGTEETVDVEACYEKEKSSLDDHKKIDDKVKLPSILVTDVGNHRLVGFNDMNGGGWITYEGDKELGIKFNTLGGIAVDEYDKIYFTDYTYEKGINSRIFRIDNLSGNNLLVYFDPDGLIGGIDIDKHGRIYYHNHKKISRIDDMTGRNRISFQPEEEIESGDVKLDSDGYIYFTNFERGALYKMKNMSGEHIQKLQAVTDKDTPDNQPLPDTAGLATIAFTPAGKIISTVWHRSWIVELDSISDTNPEYCDIDTGKCDFKRPCGVAVDSQGKIYVAEYDGSRILRMDDVYGTNMITFGSPGRGKFQFLNLHVIWTNL